MAKKEKSPAAPAPVETLVRRALELALTSGGTASWSGKSSKSLFNTNEANTPQAIERCLDPTRPLLTPVKEGAKERGRLTLTGFAEVLPDLDVGVVGEMVIGFRRTLPAGERGALSEELARRTSGANAEVYSVALAAVKAEEEREASEAAAKKRAAEQSLYRSLHETKQAECRRLEAELANAREAERALAALVVAGVPSGHEERTAQPAPATAEAVGTDHAPAAPPEPGRETRTAQSGTDSLTPVTPEDHDFRRQAARRLVASWLQQWRLDRSEGRQAIETAIGGMTGIRRIGSVGELVAFNLQDHECERRISEGEQVRIVRPGWVLDEEDGSHTLQRALVE